MTGVLIRGDGVAAHCGAHLLARAGIPAAIERTARTRLPAILLSRAAQDLVRDVFEQPQLFRDLPPIRRRIVQWGMQASPVALEHSAVVVSEEYLLDRLGAAAGTPADSPDWTIFAADPLPASCVVNRFGERTAAVTRVEPAGDPSTCRIESSENGWRFLIGGAWLISVGDAAPATCGETAGHFAAAPRMTSPVCGPGWLACGSAALAFDPLCGDGTAHAVREAILACAVIRAADAGADPAAVLQHYSARLTAGFERHLAICLQYYGSGGAGAWWEAQCAETRRGLEWCARRMQGSREFHYRLQGFDLLAHSLLGE